MNVSEDRTAKFVHKLPILKNFDEALPAKNYKPLPQNWFVAVTDVVKSREAIQSGQYKAVNMAGVAMISAIMNAIGHQDVPYIFGGDGAALACASDAQELVEEVLAKTIGWVADELGLELRAALVPVTEIRKQGSDVLVSAVSVSSAVVNFAFIGGGVGLAEKLMKKGKYRVKRAGPGKHPDLNGLSCRWMPVEQQGNLIVSLIVEPPKNETRVNGTIVKNILKLVSKDNAGGHPIPNDGPRVPSPTAGLDLEARVTRSGNSLLMEKLRLIPFRLFVWFLFKTGMSIGNFNPEHYRRFTGLNTDYRKIQDGIRMTVCVAPDTVSTLKTYLEKQREAGRIHYGLSEQDKALLTCYVPSVETDTHYHFLDGAGGGYAAAADVLR